MNGLNGMALVNGVSFQQPLYPSSVDPDTTAGGKKYVAMASNTCPPAHVLESHFSTPADASTHPRFNPLNKARPRSSALLNVNDSMAMHLLVETAIYDSTDYEILSYEEVEDLKKEFTFLTNRIEAAKRKLALESKVRDAALSLSRLYSKKGKQRRSLLGGLNDVTKHTDEELMASNRKCEELSLELWRLNNRAMEVQKRLLQHSAGVLGMTHQGSATAMAVIPRSTAPGSPSSNYTFANVKGIMSPAMTEEFDDRSFYRTPRQLEGVGDFGISQDRVESRSDHTVEDGVSAQRLEGLNNQIQNLVLEASQQRNLPSPAHLPANGGMHDASVHDQITLLEELVQYIREHLLMTAHSPSLDQAAADLAKTEIALTGLWDMIAIAEDDYRRQEMERNQAEDENCTDSDDEELQETSPEFSISAFTSKIQALHKRLLKLREERGMLRRQIVQQRRRFEDEFGASNETQTAKIEQLSQELTETTIKLRELNGQVSELSGLLQSRDDDILQANEKIQTLAEYLEKAEADARNARAELNEKAEEMVAVMQQLDVERKQDQARSLEASDALEKEDAALNLERQARLEAEEEFATKIRQKEDQLTDLENALSEMKEDRDMTKAELDAMVKETDARLKDLESQIAALKEARNESEQARTAAEEATNVYRSSVEEKEKVIGRLETETRELSEKVAELSLEVAMSKAELDQVYGSKQQRSAEADAARAAAAALVAAQQKPQTVDPGLLAEIEDLSKRNQELIDEIVVLKTEKAQSASNEHLDKRCKLLQAELDGMLIDFEGLTKQSIEHEQERTKLEQLIDSLRERVDELETMVAEEKIRSLDTSSPSIQDMRSPGRRDGESTSTSVLKQEFKKMMREQRADQQKALRAEQEERRKLETLIRNMKKDQLQNRQRPGTAGTTSSTGTSPH